MSGPPDAHEVPHQTACIEVSTQANQCTTTRSSAISPGRPVSIVGGMHTCAGDSGSGVFITTVRNGHYVYQPVGVTSAIRVFRLSTRGALDPDRGNYTEKLYGARPDLYGEIQPTVCHNSALIAPVANYMSTRGLRLTTGRTGTGS